MSTKWQRFTVEIPDHFRPAEREALGDAIVEFIQDRVRNRGLDKRNRELPGYSEAYVKSLDFKIAGKSKDDVNLTLSGDMLGALTVLSHSKGRIMIGFENGTEENAKADGNIRGTYGKPHQVGPRRDFLGLTKGDLERIVEKFTPADAVADRASRVAVGEE